MCNGDDLGVYRGRRLGIGLARSMARQHSAKDGFRQAKAPNAMSVACLGMQNLVRDLRIARLQQALEKRLHGSYHTTRRATRWVCKKTPPPVAISLQCLFQEGFMGQTGDTCVL